MSRFVALALLAACSTTRAAALGGARALERRWVLAHAETYVNDREARREAMEASLTNPENLYGQARLGAYALREGGWDALPEWQPRVEPLTDAHVDVLVAGERPARPTTPFWNEETPATWDEWSALGERVFFELPLRDEALWEPVVRDAALAARVGLVKDGDSWPGLVWVASVDGGATVGITCALCHVGVREGALEVGRARRELDYGVAQIESAERRGVTLDPVTRGRFESWGPGRADVIEDVADTPIAIPDLWGLREQRLLTQAGNAHARRPDGARDSARDAVRAGQPRTHATATRVDVRARGVSLRPSHAARA
ncbi:MAG: hypothetical protein R3B99_14155 [Polyangiales bacterium]